MNVIIVRMIPQKKLCLLKTKKISHCNEMFEALIIIEAVALTVVCCSERRRRRDAL